MIRKRLLLSVGVFVALGFVAYLVFDISRDVKPSEAKSHPNKQRPTETQTSRRLEHHIREMRMFIEDCVEKGYTFEGSEKPIPSANENIVSILFGVESIQPPRDGELRFSWRFNHGESNACVFTASEKGVRGFESEFHDEVASEWSKIEPRLKADYLNSAELLSLTAFLHELSSKEDRVDKLSLKDAERFDCAITSCGWVVNATETRFSIAAEKASETYIFTVEFDDHWKGPDGPYRQYTLVFQPRI